MVQFMNESEFTARDKSFPPKELGFGLLEWDHLLSKSKLSPKKKRMLIKHFVSSSPRSTQDTPRDDRSNYPGHWGAIAEGPTHGLDETAEEFQKATGVETDGLSGVPELYGDYGFDYSGDDSFFQGWSDEALEFNKNCPEMKAEAAQAQKIVRPLNVSKAPGFEGVEEVIPSFSTGTPYFTKNISQVSTHGIFYSKKSSKALLHWSLVRWGEWNVLLDGEATEEDKRTETRWANWKKKNSDFDMSEASFPKVSFNRQLPSISHPNLLPERNKYTKANMVLFQFLQKLKNSPDLQERDWWLSEISEASAEATEHSGFTRRFLRYDADDLYVPIFSFMDTLPIPERNKYKEALVDFAEACKELEDIQKLLGIEKMLQWAVKRGSDKNMLISLVGNGEYAKKYKKWRFNNRKDLKGLYEALSKCIPIQRKAEMSYDEFASAFFIQNLELQRGDLREKYKGFRNVKMELLAKAGVDFSNLSKEEKSNSMELLEAMEEEAKSNMFMKRGLCVSYYTGTIGVYHKDRKEVQVGETTVYEGVVNKGFKPQEPMFFSHSSNLSRMGLENLFNEFDAKTHEKNEKRFKKGKQKFHKETLSWAEGQKPLLTAHRWVLHAVFGRKNDTAFSKVTDAIDLLGEHPMVEKYKTLEQIMVKTRTMAIRFTCAVDKYKELKEKADVKRNIIFELNKILYSDSKSNETRKHEFQSYFRGLHHEDTGCYFVDNQDADNPDPLTQQQKEMDWVEANFTDENKKYQNAGFLVSQYKFIKRKCERNDIPCPFTSANDLHQKMQKFLQKEFGNYMQTVDGVEYEVSFLDFNLKTKLFLDPIKQEIENQIEAKKGVKLKRYIRPMEEDFDEEDLDHEKEELNFDEEDLNRYDELHSKEDMEFLQARDENYESEREEVLQLVLTM